MPIKCTQEVLVPFDLSSHIFSLLFFKCIESSNSKSICMVLYWIWCEWQREENVKRQFYNLSWKDNLTKRLEITRYKFSYFLSPPKFSIKISNSAPQMRQWAPAMPFYASMALCTLLPWPGSWYLNLHVSVHFTKLCGNYLHTKHFETMTYG